MIDHRTPEQPPGDPRTVATRYRAAMTRLADRDDVTRVDQAVDRIWELTRATVEPHLDWRSAPLAGTVEPAPGASPELDVQQILDAADQRVSQLAEPTYEPDPYDYIQDMPKGRPPDRARFWPLYIPLGFLLLVSGAYQLTAAASVVMLLLYAMFAGFMGWLYWLRRKSKVGFADDRPLQIRLGLLGAGGLFAVTAGHAVMTSEWLAVAVLVGLAYLLVRRLLRRRRQR